MLLVLRLLALSVAVGALAAAGTRVTSRLTERADLRIVGGFTLACFAALVEALVLGLAGIGENDIALLVAALVTWVVVRAWLPAPEPSLRSQLREAAGGLATVDAAGLGTLALAVAAALAEALWRPYTPYDGLQYHLAQPVIWLTNGHPGSLHVVNIQTPLQAYPKNTEVLLGWMLGVSHAYLVGTLLMFAFLVISAIAMVAALRRIDVPARYAVVLTVAVLTLPVAALQIAGASTDLATLCWIAVTAALCFGALEEPALLAVAFVAAGMAIGTKASAAVPVAVGLAATLILLRRRLRERPFVLGAGVVGGVAIGGLWYVQDWIVYGAPLYPFSRFPSGPTLPLSITGFNTSFLQHPVSALKTGTFHGYLEWFGGGPFLIAASLVAVVGIATWRGRDRRRLAIAVAAAVAALIVWGAGPFTGYPGVAGTTWFPLNGMRYLLPSMTVVILPIAILLSRPGLLRRMVAAGLVVVVALNLYELRHWPAPVRPAGPLVFAGAVVGVVLGGWLVVARRGGARLPPARLAGSLQAVLGVVVATAILAVAAHGYVGRETRQPVNAGDDPLAVRSVVRWLDSQPDWTDGHAPVAAGPILDALLAGPRLTHRLVLIPQSESCASVQALVRDDWIVVPVSDVIRSGPYRFATYTRASCLHTQPAFTGAGYLVFAPAVGHAKQVHSIPEGAP